MRRLLVLGGVLLGTAALPASSPGQSLTAGDTFEPVLGVPATKVTLIGVSPEGAPGEAWAQGAGPVLLRYTDASGAWQLVPVADAQGKALDLSFTTAKATARGGMLLLGKDAQGEQSVLTHDPGSAFAQAPAVDQSAKPALLGVGETLSSTAYAAIDEANGHTGALLAVTGEGTGEAGVMSYDGTRWTREPIVLSPALRTEFSSEALACGGTSASPASASPENCWLLASYRAEAGAAEQLALFRRVSSGDPAHPGMRWVPDGVGNSLLNGTQLPAGVSGVPLTAALGAGAQTLTVTPAGVWVDFQVRLSATAAPIDVSELLAPSPPASPPASAEAPTAEVRGRWCYPIDASDEGVCQNTLGGAFSTGYQSFAWAPAPGAPANDAGSRLITGSEHGVLLELASSGGFVATPGAGGDPGPGGAFSTPDKGWVDGGESTSSADAEGQSQLVRVSTQPRGDQLQMLPVPFRFPLLAVAQAPGSMPGDPNAQAVAVGDQGQVGRYTPAGGWRPESLYDAAGKVQTPTLRGVAWPTPGRAYAVGDNGAMWLWRADTGLWETDPAKPLNFIGNLTSIAFSQSDAGRGYAVGKDGVLLRFGKTWTQETLPSSLQQVNFTSVAFAGGEALATYRYVVAGRSEAGGIALDDGSGWRVDESLASIAAQPPVLSKVAGLPDGGAVAAGPGLVLERDAPGAPWRFSTQPLPEAQNVSALAAYRDGSGAVRALVSIDLDPSLDPNNCCNLETGPFGGDVAPPTGPGQPPPFPPQDPLPDTGYLLRETSTGWQDMEHMAFEAVGLGGSDMPARPDPVLAVLVDPAGNTGLAVGGQTYDSTGFHANPSFETAAAMRFPATAGAAVGQGTAAVATIPGHATFAVGGNAACVEACADFANEGLGPDVAVSHALQAASAIAAGSPGGLRAFLYTGSASGEDVFARESARSGGSLPTYAATPGGGPAGSGPYYSVLTSSGSGEAVMLIVLDESAGPPAAAQLEWLGGELAAAKRAGHPAIVMGRSAPGPALAPILVGGGASAYLFDAPEQNLRSQITVGTSHIPTFGTGTLGYVEAPGRFESDSLGSSGFLLLDVDSGSRDPATNVAPVSARVEPNISQVALDANDGVLLRRSSVALFTALARRPLAGSAVSDQSNGEVDVLGSEPYDPIPFECQGSNCAFALPTDYTFASSNPDIGDFVAHDPTSSNPRQVLLGANQLPVPDASSGLFCAFNSGTTTVSITTGGLTYSEPITVQGGSVEYPCGTVPLRNPPAAESTAQAGFTAPRAPVGSQPPAASPQIQALVPPAPVSAPHSPTPAPRPLAPLPFLPLARPLTSVNAAIVPPPPPPVARPIPPSGTSPVSQTMGAPEEKHEEESATELASSQFSAYDANEHHGSGPWLLLLVVLAAGAGTGVRRGTRRRHRDQLAFARSSSR